MGTDKADAKTVPMLGIDSQSAVLDVKIEDVGKMTFGKPNADGPVQMFILA